MFNRYPQPLICIQCPRLNPLEDTEHTPPYILLCFFGHSSFCANCSWDMIIGGEDLTCKICDFPLINVFARSNTALSLQEIALYASGGEVNHFTLNRLYHWSRFDIQRIMSAARPEDRPENLLLRSHRVFFWRFNTFMGQLASKGMIRKRLQLDNQHMNELVSESQDLKNSFDQTPTQAIY